MQPEAIVALAGLALTTALRLTSKAADRPGLAPWSERSIILRLFGTYAMWFGMAICGADTILMLGWGWGIAAILAILFVGRGLVVMAFALLGQTPTVTLWLHTILATAGTIAVLVLHE